MGDSLAGAAATSAFLVLVAMPMATAVTTLSFLPWNARYWTAGHARSQLARHGWPIAGIMLMLVPENLESLIDPAVTRALPWRDAPTAWIAALEPGIHEALQAVPLQQVWLPVLSLVYLVGFPYLIIATVVLAVWRDDGVTARRAAGAYALCFAFALPFYLLLPVDEVWYHMDPNNHGAVQQLAMHYPLVKDSLYSFNEVNNCFPSLHTAIAVAMALVARGVPRFGRFAAWWAGLIVLSTQMLGIHWLVDVAAGLLLAWVVNRLVRRIWPDPDPAPDPVPTSVAANGPV